MHIINDVTIDTTHQESEIKVIKLILLVHKISSDVESSEESLKSIDDSSDTLRTKNFGLL